MHGGSGHAGQVLVLSEKGLESHAGGLSSGGRDRHEFLGFDRLVQAVLPFAAFHLPARRLVHDHDLVVDDDIIAVSLETEPRSEGLFHVFVHPLAVDAVEERRLRHEEHLAATVIGEIDRAAIGLVDEIDVAIQPQRGSLAPAEQIDGGGRVRLREADDQRRSRFVDEDAVPFVDEGEVVTALHGIFAAGDVAEAGPLLIGALHVGPLAEPIAEKVETDLLGRAVGDVFGIRLPALGRLHGGFDAADGETELLVNRPHLVGVARSEVIVDGHDVATASGECVEKGGQGSGEGFAFAGLHFGDVPLEEGDATHELDRKMLKAQVPPRRFANEGKRLGQKFVKRHIRLRLPAQLAAVLQEIGVTERFQFFRASDDLCGRGPPARKPRSGGAAAGFRPAQQVVTGDRQRTGPRFGPTSNF